MINHINIIYITIISSYICTSSILAIIVVSINYKKLCYICNEKSFFEIFSIIKTINNFKFYNDYCLDVKFVADLL